MLPYQSFPATDNESSVRPCIYTKILNQVLMISASQMMADSSPPGNSVRRKPLPPDSFYTSNSPPVSPRSSMVIVRKPVPTAHFSRDDADDAEDVGFPVSKVEDESLRQDELPQIVSLGNCTNDEEERQLLTDDVIQTAQDITRSDNSTEYRQIINIPSTTSFLIHHKAVDAPIMSRKAWIMLVGIIVVILAIVLTLVGVGLRNSFKNYQDS
jgi:hypothetical protein